MAEEKLHPATTPKGASALTILFAVVGVSAPFLFNAQSALLFGAVAIVVIGWIYWSEASAAISARRWSAHLNVPLGAVAITLLMGIVLARQMAHQPKAVAALSAEDIAKRVDAMIQQHQPSAPASPPAPTPTVVTVPERTIILRVPSPAPIAGIPAPASAPATNPPNKPSQPPATTVTAADARCAWSRVDLTVGITKLMLEAVNDQLEYNKTKNDAKIQAQYNEWEHNVQLFFAEHVGAGLNVAPFEKAHGKPWPKPFLLIHDSGFTALKNFSAKIDALQTMMFEVSQRPCPGDEPGNAADLAAKIAKS